VGADRGSGDGVGDLGVGPSGKLVSTSSDSLLILLFTLSQ
jgi:hypothetical protein